MKRGYYLAKVDTFRLNSSTKRGFGNPSLDKANSNSQSVPMKTQGSSDLPSQILELALDSPCVCGSKLSYGNCCGKLHNPQVSLTSITHKDIINVARARFTAFAIGDGDFLIKTTHTSNKDYLQHFNDNRDDDKAKKLWLKEIRTKNSEIFEFLKFEEVIDESLVTINNNIMNASDKSSIHNPFNIDENHYKSIKHLEQQAVKFRILVRQRSNGNTIPFE
eukprot:gene12557-16841_t